MSTEVTKRSVVKQVLTITAGIVLGLAVVKLGEMGIKKAFKSKV